MASQFTAKSLLCKGLLESRSKGKGKPEGLCGKQLFSDSPSALGDSAATGQTPRWLLERPQEE